MGLITIWESKSELNQCTTVIPEFKVQVHCGWFEMLPMLANYILLVDLLWARKIQLLKSRKILFLHLLYQKKQNNSVGCFLEILREDFTECFNNTFRYCVRPKVGKHWNLMTKSIKLKISTLGFEFWDSVKAFLIPGQALHFRVLWFLHQ